MLYFNPWPGRFAAFDMMIFYSEIATLLKSVDKAIIIQSIGISCAIHEYEGTKSHPCASTIAHFLFENYWWTNGDLDYFERTMPWLPRELTARYLHELHTDQYLSKHSRLIDGIEADVKYRVLEPNLRVRLEKLKKGE